ncbi:MAG: FadR/GntR family transcriptional regulator [Pseudomonadota bacterium]
MSLATQLVPTAGQDLVGAAVAAISRHIRSAELGPGDRLPSEADLGKSLGVSRTVVREALCSLSALRLVELKAGKRATVAGLEHDAISLMIGHGVHTEQISVHHIYDVRRCIETRTVVLAALRRSDAEAEQILECAHALRNSVSDPGLSMEHDLRMHQLIGQASRNPVFALIISAFTDVTRQTWPIGWRSHTSNAERAAMADLHVNIAQAIKDGDPAKAGELMGLHFDDSIKALAAAGIS